MSTRAARDAGLHRISSLTRWIAAGAIVMAGALSAIAARALPGKKASATPAGATDPGQPPSSIGQDTAGQSSADPGSANLGSGGLVPPTQPPASGRGHGRAAVASGSS
ncbi:MAG TPA: hypothetical protein VKQ71_11940 [Acidimicrobiales bacterium]|nr:hypothetical protein [Acidimicrobiales bacterium]